VGREAVGDPGQAVDEEPGEGRMCREVAVDVPHAERRHLRRRVDDLREDPDTADEEVQAAGSATDHGRQRPEVAPRVPDEEPHVRAEDGRGQEREVVGPLDPRERLRVDDLGALAK